MLAGVSILPHRFRQQSSIPFTTCHAGNKNWVGMNDWQGRPAIRVATKVDAKALTELVLERMSA